MKLFSPQAKGLWPGLDEAATPKLSPQRKSHQTLRITGTVATTILVQ